MVEVICPCIGSSQAVVGCQEIGGSVIRRVVDHGSCACRKTSIHNQSNGLLLNSPIGAFWTIHIDVAGATVSEGSVRCILSLDFGLSAKE